MQIRKSIVFLWVNCLVLVFALDSGLCNGGKGKKTIYRGQIELAQGQVIEFSTEIDHLLFYLNSVQNKYKVLRIKILNYSEKALDLSKEKDGMVLHFADGKITGILDLARHDQEFWDALEPDLRRALVYPEIVEAGEEENIFVFIPEPALKKIPQVFIYQINSLAGIQVEILNATPAVAH